MSKLIFDKVKLIVLFLLRFWGILGIAMFIVLATVPIRLHMIVLAYLFTVINMLVILGLNKKFIGQLGNIVFGALPLVLLFKALYAAQYLISSITVMAVLYVLVVMRVFIASTTDLIHPRKYRYNERITERKRIKSANNIK